MSKKKEEEVIVDVEGLYSKSEKWIEENKQSVYIAIAAVVVLVGGYFYYTRSILAPMQEEAQLEMFKAQHYFEQDSLQLAMYGDPSGSMGFEQIADDYSSTPVGDLANYYMGVSLLKSGDYQGAIDYLESYSGNDPLIAPNALGNIGDAYLELGDLAKAKDYYLNAARTGDNVLITPRYLMKAGMVAEELGNYQEAVDLYTELSEEYSTSVEGRNAKKYMARAKTRV